MRISHRIVLHYPSPTTGQPIIYYLAKDYNLMFSILKASIGLEDRGLMVLELSGEEADYDRAIQFLTGKGVTVQPLLQDIRKDDDKCVDCGACTGVCPTGALFLIRPEMTVDLDPEKCVACGECVKACPVKAMALEF